MPCVYNPPSLECTTSRARVANKHCYLTLAFLLLTVFVIKWFQVRAKLG